MNSIFKQLIWSAPMPPSEACRYDHCSAASSLGTFQIEWKGWKERDSYCVYREEEYLGSLDTLEEAKQLAQDHHDETHSLGLSSAALALQEKAEKFAIIERCMDQLRCDEREGGIWTICSLLLIGSAHQLNSGWSVVTQEGVTIGDAEIGNWRVTVEKLDDFMDDSRDRLEAELEQAMHRFARLAVEHDAARMRDLASAYETEAREALRAAGHLEEVMQ